MKNFAHLVEDSQFYPLFENGMCPIKNILIPAMGMMEGSGVQEFYCVDVPKLTEEQRRRIAAMVAEQCGGTAAEVETHMLQEGHIPLRAIHVQATSSDQIGAFL